MRPYTEAGSRDKGKTAVKHRAGRHSRMRRRSLRLACPVSGLWSSGRTGLSQTCAAMAKTLPANRPSYYRKWKHPAKGVPPGCQSLQQINRGNPRYIFQTEELFLPRSWSTMPNGDTSSPLRLPTVAGPRLARPQAGSPAWRSWLRLSGFGFCRGQVLPAT